MENKIYSSEHVRPCNQPFKFNFYSDLWSFLLFQVTPSPSWCYWRVWTAAPTPGFTLRSAATCVTKPGGASHDRRRARFWTRVQGPPWWKPLWEGEVTAARASTPVRTARVTFERPVWRATRASNFMVHVEILFTWYIMDGPLLQCSMRMNGRTTFSSSV